MTDKQQKKQVIVLGAGAYYLLTMDDSIYLFIYSGVIGLTTALRILEKGYQVEIIAEMIPTDPKNIKYTSHWAVSCHTSSYIVQ